jgi:hypothetical protein
MEGPALPRPAVPVSYIRSSVADGVAVLLPVACVCHAKVSGTAALVLLEYELAANSMNGELTPAADVATAVGLAMVAPFA